MKGAQAMRKKIEAGERAMGSFVCELRTPAVAGFSAAEDFDFLLVDTEHLTNIQRKHYNGLCMCHFKPANAYNMHAMVERK